MRPQRALDGSEDDVVSGDDSSDVDVHLPFAAACAWSVGVRKQRWALFRG